jgi:alpha-methylacyl-CoA racemase
MGPLAGVKVLEFAGMGPAPFCAMMLSDMGAEVLRIDRPEPVTPFDYRYLAIDRGRRSVILDLKKPEAREAALRLVAKADVLVEGYRPGVMESLGLSPEACLKANRRLVYGRMTGWGQDGPLAHAAGHDINYIGLAGVLWSIGRSGEAPVPPLNVVGDFGGGAMYLAFGIACALFEARQSGEGQVIDAAMIDGDSSLITMLHGLHAGGLWESARGRNAIDGGAPWYDVYETADGEYVAIGPVEPRFYAQLLSRLELDAADLPDQYDRAGWPRLREAFAERFRTATRAEWCARLEGTDVCFAPVLAPLEVPDHPHMVARKAFIEIDGIRQPAPAPRFSRTIAGQPTPPPRPGTHTREAMLDWGLAPDDVERLVARGIAIQA